MRNLDLVGLLCFAASWWFFNQGQIFTSVPLAYPPLIYLLGRMIWLGVRGRSRAPSPPRCWPVWVLVAAATVFIAGLQDPGLNVEASNVIDVGYAGVIGAQRIEARTDPYGNFPVREGAEPARARLGRQRPRPGADEQPLRIDQPARHLRPIAYIAYVPGYLAAGWSGSSAARLPKPPRFCSTG